MQSRLDSFMEALTNTIIGLVISTIANYFVIPMILGVRMTHGQNFALAMIFTVISIARSYVLRRAFNGKSVWSASKGLVASYRHARKYRTIRPLWQIALLLPVFPIYLAARGFADFIDSRL